MKGRGDGDHSPRRARREVNSSDVDSAASSDKKSGRRKKGKKKVTVNGATDPPAVTDDRPIKDWVLINAGDFECPYCKYSAPSARGLSDHRLSEHLDREIWFKCPTCTYRSQNYHATSCHRPKCKGEVAVEKEMGDYGCRACSREFNTKIGLGQHEKSAHPEVREAKRIEARERDILRKRQARAAARDPIPKTWTDDEVELLKSLVKQFAADRFINKKIAEFLPSKTIKQISDKRRLLPKDDNE